ncbi:MAG: serine hydrolase domain-containing protein, partial [Candidatus Acidiferrales bacterium]
MSLRVRCFAVAFTAVCCSILTAFAPSASPQAPTPDQLNAIFSGIASPQEPGLAVLIRQNGHALFEHAYGMRDLRSGLPIDAHTNFRLASFTKQFTAMAIMLLVHDGKLHYDDHLTDIFPDFPAYGHTITIRNLLNHTSGLIAYEDLMDKQYAGKQWYEIPQITDAGVLALAEQQTSTKFPPGTNWEYSNGGYCILGAIIAKVSEMPYPEFLRQRIFAPLEMDQTVAHVYGKDEVASRAYGYTNDAGVWLETDQSPTSATLGDGGVYTSLDDLAKWDDALRNHTLLSAAEFQPAVTPAPIPPGAANWPKADTGAAMAYGFGWFLDPYRGHARMWHTGSSIGFRTVIERFTENNLTIIILSNRGDLDTSALALKAADLYFPVGSYPNSTQGLHDFLSAAIAAAKSGDAETLTSVIDGTEIPNCPQWVT